MLPHPTDFPIQPERNETAALARCKSDTVVDCDPFAVESSLFCATPQISSASSIEEPPVDDASFNVSLDAERERTDLAAINFECDDSAISSLERAGDGYWDETSCVPFGMEKKLTINELCEFDDEIRRAEC